MNRGEVGGRRRRRRDPPVYGRSALLVEVRDYLARGHNVLLLGPRDVGKTAIIRALDLDPATVLDPFMGVSPRLAGAIRLAMDRGGQWVAASRTANRAEMGAVRRLAFRFSTVRVPPLSAHWIRRVLADAYAQFGLDADAVTAAWTADAVRLSRGLPGLAIAIVESAAEERRRVGHLPLPQAAYVLTRMRRVELHSVRDGLGQLPARLRQPGAPGLDGGRGPR